ncbi:hypothetical protein [Microvirga sp. 17 mud 1-3]|uniref:hypothetical protein n=1 Tax=Microvirga sp. 17 mud 1-3 TaxID=2082949 RepID=UPI0013A5B1B8|nr:hypothetical protein [Microvirga sp. 17 mud 1-3]
MRASVSITAAMKRRAYDYYVHHPSVPVKSIASFLGTSVTTFRRLRRLWAWPPRAEALASAAEAGAPDSDSNSPGGLREAAQSLVAVTRARIDALVAQQRRPDETLDHDRTARTLASYARTLTAAQALLEQEGSSHDVSERKDVAPARSLHDLRDELARHLERIVAEEEARGRDGLLV